MATCSHDHTVVPQHESGAHAESAATSRERRGPEISCGCGHCHTHDHAPEGPLNRGIAALVHSAEHVLPHRASQWLSSLQPEGQRDLVSIVAAALLFCIGLAVRGAGAPLAAQIIVFGLAYLAVGADIVANSVRNVRSGSVFDENLLMTVASLGAFALGEYPEAVAVMMFYRIGEFFEDRAVDRSRDQIMDAVDMRPETVNVLDGYTSDSDQIGTYRTIPAGQASEGDYVLVRPGERIPLDATVVAGTSSIDTSPVTGEPLPVDVEVGAAVTSGCINVSGQLVVRVDKPLNQSMVTRILDSVEHAAANKPQIERFITRFARIYTPIVIAIAVATAIIPSVITGNVSHWLYTACTFLVISCPCALVLSIPLTFFAGIGAASKQGILVKGGSSIEALHGIRSVVMDKTGTITQGTFTVQDVYAANGCTEDEVLRWAAAVEASSTHPIAQSIVAAAPQATATVHSLKEHAGFGLEAHLSEGSAEDIHLLVGNARLLDQAGIDVPASVHTQASTQVLVACNGKFAGSIALADTIKDDSPAAIQALKRDGIYTVMLTGDASSPAQAVAETLGIDEVHAQLLPEKKVEALQQVRTSHGSTMFVGDGINDAPVLAAADVGAAMGSGSDAAIQAADVVFMRSRPTAIAQSLALSHAVHRVAVQNITFALVVKIGIMILGFAGFASMWAAVFADVGVALLCILNAIRLLRTTSKIA